MMNSTMIARLCLPALCGLAVAVVPAWGQSRADLSTTPGSTITLTVAFTAYTDTGPLGGTDTDSTSVDGTARVTVLPTDPPFTHCRVHTLSMSVGYLEFYYYLRTLRATFTDLVIESTEPLDGAIDGAGNVTFADASLRVTGNVQLYSPVFGIDQTMLIDVTSVAAMSARLSEGEDAIILDQISLPTVEWDVPPKHLPKGFQSLVVTVDMVEDESNVVFRGAYAPSPLGDGNGDGHVDLADYPSLFYCLTGPIEIADTFCSIFHFDDDGDVDLFDLAEFLNVVEPP